MNWKYFFYAGFIYSSCTVLFGWLLSRWTSLTWTGGCMWVVLADLAFRRILDMAGRAVFYKL